MQTLTLSVPTGRFRSVSHVCLRAWLLALLLVAPVAVAQDFTTLHSFTGGTNGANPYAGLLLSGETLYGTTANGSGGGHGTVFSINTNGTEFTTLRSFTGLTDGANPQAGLILSGGTLYGTTLNGGPVYFIGVPYGTPNGYGTVFAIGTSGTGFTVLHGFTNSPDGSGPYGGLVLDGNTLYGTTYQGGGAGYGTVFSINTDGLGFTNLYSFSMPLLGTNSDGANPYSGLILSGGTLYGTTANGGNGGHGTVFSLNTNGTGFAILHSFSKPLSGTNGDGANPYSGLVLSGNTLYGTAANGGSGGYGTVFSINTDGTGFANLHSFTFYEDGAFPEAGLILSGSTLFGTADVGGSSGYGTIFAVNTSGTSFATLYSFTPAYGPASTNSDGAEPVSGLILSGDTLYGTARFGGSGGIGTVLSLSLQAAIAVQPVSQTNYVGSTVIFAVVAGPPLLSYQWQRNGTNLVDGGNISGSTSNTLTLASISDSDAATYSVIVSNAYGSLTSSNATLTVIDLPFIATQPLSQIVGVGSNVTFTVVAYGAPPLVFQWYYGNSPVGSPTTGTNVSSYTLTEVQTNQSGNYSVRVFNGYGNATSSNAVLTVQVFPPVIGTQPTNQSVLVGGTASFAVSVSGSAPFSYQWYFNDSDILDATNAAYSIFSVGINNAGSYYVVVTNSAGSVTSSSVVLTVVVPPSLSLQFLAGYPLLSLDGMLSNNYVVQYSTNLATTNWTTLLSLSNLPFTPYQFLDPSGQGQPVRFYRTIMQ